jgi:3,4-dihydroxy-9,10-secoandrosta-1,3,5(10)-triene-9,17-dione 4,5-dioxygenase
METKEVSLAGLGYVGIAATDPKGWSEFATQVCGLVPSRVVPGPREGGIPIPSPNASGFAGDGTAYLKMDRRQWRLAVHPAESNGLAYLGFETRSVADFERAVAAIAKRGVTVRDGLASELEARSVERLTVFEDPAGHRLELFQAPIIDDDFSSPSGIEFKTGEFGMGHVVLFVPDIDAALVFYRDVLEFKRTDFMQFGPDGRGIHFLRCTRRHHSVALLHVGPQSGVQHLMFEATTIDGVGKALDRAISAGVEVSSSLGRHRNDKTVSFYMKGPSGFDVEVGWDGLVVEDDWVEHEFAGGGDDWGHHGLTAESLEPDDC